MSTLAFFNLGATEVIVLVVLGILVFGKRLPDIGRNVGKSIVEFKKGLAGVDEDVNAAANAPRAGNMAPPAQQFQQPQQYAAPQAQQYQQPPQQIPAQQQPQAQAQPASQPDQTNRQA